MNRNGVLPARFQACADKINWHFRPLMNRVRFLTESSCRIATHASRLEYSTSRELHNGCRAQGEDSVSVMGGLERVRSGELLYTDEVGRDACGIGGVAARDGKPSPRCCRRPSRPQVHGAPRRRLRRRRRRYRHHNQHPQAFLKEEAKRLSSTPRLKPEDDHRRRSRVLTPTPIPQGEKPERSGSTGQAARCSSSAPGRCRPRDALPARQAHQPECHRTDLCCRSPEPSPDRTWALPPPPRDCATRSGRGGLRGVHSFTLDPARQLQGARDEPAVGGLLRRPHRPAFEIGIAPFHRRYSTNTFPNWTLAQPFRVTCHNGEINTIGTTRNAVHAFARALRPPLPGGDLLTPKMSDSAGLDEWIEYRMLEQNWSLLAPRCEYRHLRVDLAGDAGAGGRHPALAGHARAAVLHAVRQLAPLVDANMPLLGIGYSLATAPLSAQISQVSAPDRERRLPAGAGHGARWRTDLRRPSRPGHRQRR